MMPGTSWHAELPRGFAGLPSHAGQFEAISSRVGGMFAPKTVPSSALEAVIDDVLA
jgi:hypothetical protein